MRYYMGVEGRIIKGIACISYWDDWIALERSDGINVRPASIEQLQRVKPDSIVMYVSKEYKELEEHDLKRNHTWKRIKSPDALHVSNETYKQTLKEEEQF